MRSRIAAVAIAFIFVVGLCASIADGSPQYAKYLAISDVEQVTGLKGVKLIPKNPGDDEDLTFATQDGKIVLSVMFLPANAYAGAKSSTDGVKSALKDVGEEGFVGPASGPPLYILVFRKAAYTVILNTELEGEKQVRIPIEKLTAIAKLIASRL